MLIARFILTGLCLMLTISAQTAQLAATNTVKQAKSTVYGDYITDGNGVTLYMFEKDTANKSTCYGTCATDWPPYVLATGTNPLAGTGVTQSLLSTFTRTDATRIVTYNGMPLYYYKGEVGKPNIVGCQAKVLSGGLWFLVEGSGRVNFTTAGRPANLASKNTLEVATSATYGQYVTDVNGVVLYVFEKDLFLASNCYSTCAVDWPPYILAAGVIPTYGTGIDGSSLYWTTRTDGKVQVTLNGWPLYYYKGETTAGTTKCQAKNMNGGIWWLQKPNGDIIKTPAGSSSSFLSYGVGLMCLIFALLF